MADDLPACADWLQQGDLFANVPCPVPGSDGPAGNTLRWRVEYGPALLMTYDCQLDKKKAERIHFAPARLLSTLDGSSQVMARRENEQPYDALYIGFATDRCEYFCRPSETFWLPLSCIGTSSFVDLKDGEPERRCIGDATRLGTLPPDRRVLLRAKLNAFWTGRVEQEPELDLGLR